MTEERGFEIVGPPEPIHKRLELAEAIGKTIAGVEFGAERFRKDTHEREAIVLTFADGTALRITVGSNARNLSWKHARLSPSDFSTDLMTTWVEPNPDALEEHDEPEFPWEEEDEGSNADVVIEIRRGGSPEVVKMPEDLSWSVRYVD